MTTIHPIMLSVTTKTPECIIDDITISEISPNVTMYGVNLIVGSICMVAVCLNLIVLLSCKKFRQQYMVG
uniref:G_PROTEIN_RECEP_F1_2 domain-containing protein n=1 Tax=Panagrellus redivivus TaxID=6233 RepID=A0A7E4VRM4_PANRE